MDVSGKSSNEKRLIDADALLNEFLKRYTERERNRNLVFAACEIKQDFADMISDFPTVDAEVVVRCKDCKHRIYKRVNDWIGKIGGCGIFDYPMPDDFFCSYGKRKEGDGNE